MGGTPDSSILKCDNESVIRRNDNNIESTIGTCIVDCILEKIEEVNTKPVFEEVEIVELSSKHVEIPEDLLFFYQSDDSCSDYNDEPFTFSDADNSNSALLTIDLDEIESAPEEMVLDNQRCVPTGKVIKKMKKRNTKKSNSKQTAVSKNKTGKPTPADGVKKKGRPKSQDEHQCDHCNKCFKFPSLLKIHIRTHIGEKVYKCPACEKSFSKSCHRKRHMDHVHAEKVIDGVLQQPKIEQKCEICQKVFHNASYFRKHMLLHSDKQPFICEFPNCGKTFGKFNFVREIHIILFFTFFVPFFSLVALFTITYVGAHTLS